MVLLFARSAGAEIDPETSAKVPRLPVVFLELVPRSVLRGGLLIEAALLGAEQRRICSALRINGGPVVGALGGGLACAHALCGGLRPCACDGPRIQLA